LEFGPLNILWKCPGTCLLAGIASAEAPDNASVNEHDHNAQALTPRDQSNTKADTQVVANIRTALTDEKALSTNAQNVKVIVRDDIATLRGLVASASEKACVVAIAQKAQFEAKRYEEKIRSGNILISVHTEGSKERDRAKAIFKDADADDIASSSEA
jgi:mevalonate kinase